MSYQNPSRRISPHPRSKDMLGLRFGKLLVVEEVGSIDSKTAWRCLCDCGNLKIVKGKYLRQGKVKSCGLCYMGSHSCVDISGNIYGKLTALYLWNIDEKGKHRWLFLCDCGKVCIKTKTDVVSGHTKSCGCYRDNLEYILYGENHPQWKGGITELKQAVRSTPQYISWRSSVYIRDSYMCKECGQKGNKLQAHHIVFLSTLFDIYNISTIEEALNCPPLWDINNGITLCKECHASAHKGKGVYINNRNKLL